MPNDNDTPKMLTGGLEGVTVIYKFSSTSGGVESGGGAPVYAGSSSDGFGGEPGAIGTDAGGGGGGNGPPSTTNTNSIIEIVTEEATDPEAIAQQERLRNGEGTPSEALAYFQEHGFPWLTTLPTWDANLKKWLFPAGSLPADLNPNSFGRVGFGIAPGPSTGHSSAPSGESTAGTNSRAISSVVPGLSGLGSGKGTSTASSSGGGTTVPAGGPNAGATHPRSTGDDSEPLWGTANFRVNPNDFEFQPQGENVQRSKCVTYGVIYKINGKPMTTPILLRITIKAPRFKGGREITARAAALESALAVSLAGTRLEESLNLGLVSPTGAQREFQRLVDLELKFQGGPAWEASTCG